MNRKLLFALVVVAAVAIGGVVLKGAGEVTFTADIAPILYENCVGCHRPGEAGPFNLITYSDAKKRASQIQEVTQSRYMPPWLPEPGPDFADNRRLSDEEIATIARWVAAGAPEGNPIHLPPVPTFKRGWQLGTPDLVVEMEEDLILPAESPTGSDIFRILVIPIPNKEPKWVQAIEVRPTNRRVVHHALVAFETLGSARRLDEKTPEPGYEGLNMANANPPPGDLPGYLPGRQPFAGYPDVSWQLEPGTDVVLQMHMIPTGKPEKVRMKVGFYFAEQPPKREAQMLKIGPQFMDIAVGDKDYVMTDSYTLPVAVDLLSIQPHAHYIGKELIGTAQFPDGREISLLHIKDWDFNWQDGYRYANPVSLPAGTKLSLEYHYDNSVENKRNPNPPKRVRYGWNSADEMCEMWFQVVPKSQQKMAQLKDHAQRIQTIKEISWYEKELRLDPDNMEFLRSLAFNSLKMGNVRRALECWQHALKLDPNNADTLWSLGMIRARQGSTTRAVKLFHQAIDVDPVYVNSVFAQPEPWLAELNERDRALFQLGQMLMNQKKLRLAFREVDAIARKHPERVEILMTLAVIHQRAGELPQAIRAYERVLEIDPDTTGVRELVDRLKQRVGEQG